MIARDELKSIRQGQRLVRGYPIIEAEVVFAARYDWARHAEDVIARRTRLAFLNKELAMLAIPRVVELMGNELRWDEKRRHQEIVRCVEFMRHFGGPIPSPSQSRDGEGNIATASDISDALLKWDPTDSIKPLDKNDVRLVAELLGHPLNEEDITDCIRSGAGVTSGYVSKEEFSNWWMSSKSGPALKEVRKRNMVSATNVEGSGIMFG